MTSIKLLLFFTLPVLFAACKHEHDHHTAPADTEKPVINLVTPSEQDTSYSQGDVIRISGSTSDNQQIQEVHIELLNEGLPETQSPYLIHDHLHPAASSATFDVSHTVNSAVPAEYLVRIRTDDKAGNHHTVERRLTIIP